MNYNLKSHLRNGASSKYNVLAVDEAEKEQLVPFDEGTKVSLPLHAFASAHGAGYEKPWVSTEK